MQEKENMQVVHKERWTLFFSIIHTPIQLEICFLPFPSLHTTAHTSHTATVAGWHHKRAIGKVTQAIEVSFQHKECMTALLLSQVNQVVSHCRVKVRSPHVPRQNVSLSSVLAGRNGIFQAPDKLYPQLGRGVPLQLVVHETGHHFRLDHLECSSNHPGNDVAVLEVDMAVGQLDKLGQRVALQDQRELVTGGAPVGDGRVYAQVHLERHLDFVRRVSKVVAPAHVCSCQEVLDESESYVVSHSVQLLVDLLVTLVILQHLGYQGAIG